MRMRWPLLCFLGCALACGDDASNAADSGMGGSADSGVAGRGGAGGRGGIGGTFATQKCREDKFDTLSAWCDEKDDCELSLSARWNIICQTHKCEPSDCYFSTRNSCGGYSIQHVIGVDAYSDEYHYDSDGILVGVRVQPSGIPCAGDRDYYGTVCQRESGSLACDEADAGEP